MAVAVPPLPGNSTPILLIVLLWLAWAVVLVVADFLAFMMLAFADSPDSARAAKLMIAPFMIWLLVTLTAGIVLLIFRGWWQVPLAFALAISPPFLMFLGYNLLAAAPRVSPAVYSSVAVPTVSTRVPPTAPAPTVVSTDFQAKVNQINQSLATQREMMNTSRADDGHTRSEASSNQIDPLIANKVLDLAQEWGEDFMKPTQSRAAKLFPHLTQAQLDEYDRIAREAMRAGHDVMYGNPNATYGQCAAAVRESYPWVDADNLSRIYSQGQYYANK